jgi:hypothetical protein
MTDEPTTAEPQKPRRRWFQFRLRTLLVGVVLLSIPCAYVANQWRIVAARRNWLEQHPQPMFTVDITVIGNDGKEVPQPEPTVPPIRRWLGDEPTKYVDVRSSAEEKAARQIFPEATRIFCGFDADLK